MDIWNTITDNVFGVATMLIVCTIPVLMCLFVIRRFTSATKKTINVFRR